ncbi:MAG: hypothetical protein B7X09_03450 [Acidiphilium sp. 21-66-27]|nr:MAG: hypothetical protein B7X09_03450 [Acidiphilium sp. 21-66-27]
MSALTDEAPPPDRPGSRPQSRPESRAELRAESRAESGSEKRFMAPEDRLLWPQLFPYRRRRGRAALNSAPRQERESEETAA